MALKNGRELNQIESRILDDGDTTYQEKLHNSTVRLQKWKSLSYFKLRMLIIGYNWK